MNMLFVSSKIVALTFVWFFWIVMPVAAQQQGRRLESPLDSNISTIPQFIEGFLRAIVIIALPLITIFIVYAGFKYIAARGNSGKISEAHENFKWVVIGAILILSAWILATLIGGTVSQLVR
jgi:hypothetical protein